MPTKKRRIGFIPRSDVLDLINKLSFESNLSISKIINILVEEALYKRGIFNINSGQFYQYESRINLDKENQIFMKNDYQEFSSGLNNLKKNKQHHFEEASDEFIDMEIYEKFLMFLQFQEKMKKRN